MPTPRATLVAVLCAGMLAPAVNVRVQTVSAGSQSQAHGQARSPNQNPGTAVNPDAALEIAPRVAPVAETPPSSIPADSGDLINSTEPELPPVPTVGPPSSMVSKDYRQPLPYLGICVQRIESHSAPGREVEGLEIVSVDPDSPAEYAGLKGRGAMSSLGASGATAGALMPPLDIALMPLLKKTGQLGQTGDLIIAIDDRRVTSEADLETALGDAKPGDMIYLTVVRLANDGVRKTIKLPVRLGNPAAP